jgi:hypothetical protein
MVMYETRRGLNMGIYLGLGVRAGRWLASW